ncbi:MAG: TIGR01620 family protein [Hyphomicrobiales bacterium]
MTEKARPKPRSFDISDGKPEKVSKSTKTKRQTKTEPPAAKPKALNVEDVTLTNDVVETLDERIEINKKPKRGIGWLSIFFAALGMLASLAIGLAVDQLIRDLFSRHEWLGWFGAALTLIVIIAALAVILREVFALSRLRSISALRERANVAYEKNDKAPAEDIEREITTLYEGRADMAAGRAALHAHKDDIIDGRGRIALVEREFLKHLDDQANKLVMNSAKRVAIVTAVSPRALVDIIYVLAENLRLIRALSTLYGGRPGTLGFFRLTRNVLSHLALTGAISIGDGLMQQVVGSGIAARLSARFGEGVVNGLLTARIGLAAHDVCRPVPFLATKRPSIAVYMNALIGLNGKKDAPK